VDQSLALDNIKVESTEQVSDFNIANDNITFLYKKESELKFKKINKSEGPVQEQTEKIKTNDPMDEIRSERDSDGFVRQWYGNSFFVWGYQTIRNIKSEDRVRDVFYINKVVATKSAFVFVLIVMYQVQSHAQNYSIKSNRSSSFFRRPGF